MIHKKAMSTGFSHFVLYILLPLIGLIVFIALMLVFSDKIILGVLF